MDETEFFHEALDNRSSDQAARLLLALFNEERGDPLAAGLRWMVESDKSPLPDQPFISTTGTWDWWSMLPGWNNGIGDSNDRSDRIEPDLMGALEFYHRKSNWSGDCAYCEYLTRREAETALCRAFNSLRLGRRVRKRR